MRYPRHHKRATRARILAAAARQLLEKGLAGASVQDVMRDAGLTHGGFYAHFKSKEVLVRAALKSVMDERRARLFDGLDDGGGEDALVQVVGRYLNRHHRDDRAGGCALPALAGEVARAGPRTRRSFERGVRALAGELARREGGTAGVGGAATSSTEERALATLALCAGGVMLARAVRDGQFSDDILRACRRLALAGAGR